MTGFESMDAALALVAPGTPLREGIDDVLAARTGGLIVIGGEQAVAEVCSGGFRVDVPFTPQRVFELAKMDGAIVLDDACEQVLMANVHLVPDSKLPTDETGMRHRAAERVSMQTGALVISISQSRRLVNVYLRGRKATLDTLEVALARADQALGTLRRYRARLDETLSRLTELEFEDLVTFADVAIVIRRFEMARRVAAEAMRQVARLGTQGRLVRLQADEFGLGLEDEYTMLLRDYAHDSAADDISAVSAQLAGMPMESLLEQEGIAVALGYPSAAQAVEEHVHARGFRLLRGIPMLPTAVVTRLVERFDGVPGLLHASEDHLDGVDGVGARRARAIAEGLRRMRHNSAI